MNPRHALKFSFLISIPGEYSDRIFGCIHVLHVTYRVVKIYQPTINLSQILDTFKYTEYWGWMGFFSYERKESVFVLYFQVIVLVVIWYVKAERKFRLYVPS